MLPVPGSSVPGRMTKEEVHAVREEKLKDTLMQQELEKLYGSPKSHTRRVYLTRDRQQLRHWEPWSCPSCHQSFKAESSGGAEIDARRVCGVCVHPEPSTSSSRASANLVPLLPPGEAGREERSSTNMSKIVPVRGGAEVLKVPLTGRCYRIFPADALPTTAEAPLSSGTTSSNAHPAPSRDTAAEAFSSPFNPTVVPFAPFSTATPLGQAAATPTGHLPRRNPNKADYTHFVAIPIGTLSEVQPQLKDLLERIQAEGCSDESGDIPPELLNSVERMHITLLLLSLHTPEAVEMATDALRQFQQLWEKQKALLLGQNEEWFSTPARAKAVAGSSTNESVKPLIRLGGLYVMPPHAQMEKLHDQLLYPDTLPYHSLQKGVDATHASVVFMGLGSMESLRMIRHIQDVLFKAFSEVLLTLSEEERTAAEASKRLLHLTVLNKKWRSAAGKRAFDATRVLEKFGDAVIEGGTGGSVAHGFAVDKVILCPLSEPTSMWKLKKKTQGAGKYEATIKEKPPYRVIAAAAL